MKMLDFFFFFKFRKLKLNILHWFNPFRGGLGTLSGYLSQQGFEPESATL
ncbi:hypothetical protein ACJIZ3_008081 [Penstemon smallii]|uniref:Uncharacterized protein n=1 Tax=Penstemon smallii TaxID=265156 RepID=A0ABD3T8Q9_9LAMI